MTGAHITLPGVGSPTPPRDAAAGIFCVRNSAGRLEKLSQNQRSDRAGTGSDIYTNEISEHGPAHDPGGDNMRGSSPIC